MDWDKLKIFHAVAQAGSFTEASGTLNLSQSAISRQIQSLEQTLKTSLLKDMQEVYHLRRMGRRFLKLQTKLLFI